MKSHLLNMPLCKYSLLLRQRREVYPAMGERHGKYGVKPEHYDWVGQSLIKTFEHFFADAWTDDLEVAWIHAYNWIAATMLKGAKTKLQKKKKAEVTLEDVATRSNAQILVNRRKNIVQYPFQILSPISGAIFLSFS